MRSGTHPRRVAFSCPGGVPEWLNGAVSKTVRGLWVPRGFESHPLRCAVRARATRTVWGLAPRLKRSPPDDLDLVPDLEGAEQPGIGLDAPVRLLHRGRPRQRPVGPQTDLEVQRMRLAVQLELAADLEVLRVVRRGYPGRPEFDRPRPEHLLLERVLDLDLVLVCERHDPAGSLNHLEGAGVRAEHEA